MTKDKLVSVVIPAFNSAQFIADALNSILTQTYKNYEIIVVDDGSTDNTGTIVKSYASSVGRISQTKDQRPEIRYIYQDNSGPSTARNRGIKESKGEYIAFLDSDDEWLPNKLEKQVKLLDEKRNIGLVTCGRNIIDQLGNQTISVPSMPADRKKMFNSFTLTNIVGSCSCVMIRKSCIDAAGSFDESLKVGEDWDMWLRIARTADISSIDESLANYHVRPGSQSGSGTVNLENELRLLKKIFAESTSHDIQKLKNRAYSYRYYKAAIAYRENGSFSKMRDAILNSITINPINILNWNILSFFITSITKYR